MKDEIELKGPIQIVPTGDPGRLHRSKPQSCPRLYSMLAGLGIFLGISSLISGMLCVVVHSLDPWDTAFNTVGTVLLISAIPMLFAGACFLDKIDQI
ncbi:MAG: hypothetical protein ABIV48_08770 [Pyrinomonadaceae bacterium]